jgi:hypothetical protein
MILDKKTCSTCEYMYYDGDKHADGWDVGECHRFPPVFCGKKIYDDADSWEQPKIIINITVCGEHKERHVSETED